MKKIMILCVSVFAFFNVQAQDNTPADTIKNNSIALDEIVISVNREEEQAKLEKRIAQLETALASVRILDENEIDDSKVSILTTIKVKNLKANKEFTYKMVSEIEADFKTGKLSVISPIGKGLLGHKKGEKVIIQTPAGAMEYQILDIKK